jgi:hypothetical protein
MTVPTRAWVGVPADGVPGNFTNWDEDAIAANVMIEDFADLIAAAFWNDQVTLDSYTIYHYPSEEADPVPVYQAALAVDGSLVSATWIYAVETTYDFRTTEFGIFKLVAIDGPSGDSFEDNPSWFVSGAGAAVANFVISSENAFSGRDNARPAFPQPYSRTINDRLHAKYGRNPFG